MSENYSTNHFIQILEAKQNNLKGIDVNIPINRLTVITGVSGSGKSSLAFDTLYAEGQRRYVESLSAYARQFLERINKPHVREIIGISPPVAIKQRTTSRNPRSTVGTVTEIYDYLRLLFSRVGIIKCRECGHEVRNNTIEEVHKQLISLPRDTRIYITFPFKGSRLDLNSDKQSSDIPLKVLLENLLKLGFQKLISSRSQNIKIHKLPEPNLASLKDLERTNVLIDRLVIQPDIQSRLTDSLELCYLEGNGICEVFVLGKKDQHKSQKILRFTERFECQYCQISYRTPEPRLFSFNNPYGACPTCQGFGNTITLDQQLIIPDQEKTIADKPIEPFTKPRYRRFQKKLETYAEEKKIPLDIPFKQLSEKVRRKIWEGEKKFPGVLGFFRYLEKKKYKMHIRIFISRYRSYTLCSECTGERLCQEARDVYVEEKRITQLIALSIDELQKFFTQIHLTNSQLTIAKNILKEIKQRLNFLMKVGLEYLTLNRLTSTLSGGEIQRIHLAASLSSSLVGTLYVLDEPSIGLHAKDEKRLIEILKYLRDLGNTIVVVEHEKEMIKAADHIIDLGPGAGEQGGHLVHSGDLPSILHNHDSLTGNYLTGNSTISTPVFRRPTNGNILSLYGAQQHNLKNISVNFPLGVMVCVTGVSGSGKSTLVHEVLYAGLKKLRQEWKGNVGKHDRIEGWEQLSEVLLVDQTPIGKTPRSNPVTYIKAFDEIRKLFASTRASQSNNLKPSHFSFNVSGGRCETCRGSGTVTVEMQFLADVELLCESCKGNRYRNKILQVTYKGKTIADVLQLTVTEALVFFRSNRLLVRKLKVLDAVGLGYLRLGQSATTLSGGEAQRIKLAAHLSKKTSKQPLFIFDEPTTGLHFQDISRLLRAFDKLISQGASLIIIEHNLDVIKCSDWIIDLGPQGGKNGGQVVAEGPPEIIVKMKSYTGKYLQGYLTD